MEICFNLKRFFKIFRRKVPVKKSSFIFFVILPILSAETDVRLSAGRRRPSEGILTEPCRRRSCPTSIKACPTGSWTPVRTGVSHAPMGRDDGARFSGELLRRVPPHGSGRGCEPEQRRGPDLYHRRADRPGTSAGSISPAEAPGTGALLRP